jgi:outer membrane protein OmpA-like peptidoglycan-associated protein
MKELANHDRQPAFLSGGLSAVPWRIFDKHDLEVDSMTYCTKCGNQLESDMQFCARCGTPVHSSAQSAMPEQPVPPAAPAAPQPTAATTWQAVPVAPPPQQAAPVAPLQQPVASAKSGCLTTVLIVLAVLALVVALAIGGVIYGYYKLKQKATAFLHEAAPSAESLSKPGESKPGSPPANPSDSAAGLIGSLTGLLNAAASNETGDAVDSVSDTDPVEPCPEAPYPPQTGARVPMLEGTVITTAWGVKYEDVESRMSLDSPTATSISQKNKTDAYKNDFGTESQAISSADTVCNADLASGATYVTTTGITIPHLIHGVTRLRLSEKSFNEIKTSGKTELRYTSFTDGVRVKPYSDGGLLTRVEPQDVPYPMIVNDQRVNLPAIHLAGKFESVGKDPRPKKIRPQEGAAEMYVIDDPLNPLVLLWKIKDPQYRAGRFRIEVVKIEYKTAQPVNTVEKQLTEQKRAVTYGIYFDFNKDTIKPESEAVLKEIVQAMTDNPGWKLTVEGHTDNIGADAYNLDLSKRRAAAVKQALVARYHIAADRLSTDGFGPSRPVDSNDTLEGRARNRRVELTRE